MHWKIWYINDITVEGTTEADWIAAPDEGVLAIAVNFGVDRHGRKLTQTFSGTDWYWMYEGTIYQNDDSTWEIDYWVPNPAPIDSFSKKGKWTTDEYMAYINQLLIEWIR